MTPARRLRVAVVCRHFPVLSETFVLDQVTGLMALGHDVRVYSHGAPPFVAPLQESVDDDLTRLSAPWPEPPHGIRLRLHSLLDAARRLSWRAIWKLFLDTPGFNRRQLRKTWHLLLRARQHADDWNRCDVIHAHFGPEAENMARLKAAGILRTPLLATLHGFDACRPARQHLRPYPCLLRHASKIHVTTGFMGAQAEAIGFRPEQLHRLPYGIVPEHFPFTPRHLPAGAAPSLITVGRLVEKKGVEIAIRAIAELARQGISTQYSIIGDGPLRRQLEALTAALGIADRVHFLGPLSRAASQPHLNRAQVFLFPSMRAADGDCEGQGLVGLEAQAAGLLLIASRHGGIPECLKPGETGILVPPGDPVALATAVASLLDHQETWEAMSCAGRKLVEDEFSHQHHLHQLEALYYSL